ncbi:hypothetical protein BDW71DRAFT_64406 [Aspergillus fruticulosus]
MHSFMHSFLPNPQLLCSVCCNESIVRGQRCTVWRLVASLISDTDKQQPSDGCFPRYHGERHANIGNVGANKSEAVDGNAYNSVLPVWTDTLILMFRFRTTWFYDMFLLNLKYLRRLTAIYVPRLTELAPNSGAYLSEVSIC